MPGASFIRSIDAVPPGRWAVGVSGGADSVALLRLLCGRPDLTIRVVHLDHETREGQSHDDATFVVHLARTLGVPCDIATRSAIEPLLERRPRNRSALFRALRLSHFLQVVRQHALQGVVLAHHADDQCETVLLRLLRGSGPGGLAGMSERAIVDGLVICRPLLSTRRADLRAYLNDIHQPWREDASNVSDDYLRNRLRKFLAQRPVLHERLLELRQSARQLNHWIARHAPEPGDTLCTEQLGKMPHILAAETIRRWLTRAGSPQSDLSARVIDRLLAMATDAASPPRQHFPGGLSVKRRRGELLFGPLKK